MTAYVPEEFASAEADVLRRYFTNLDGPVFALVNLPEVVKGALFARYSRSPKSLRRLFLDEFVGDLDISGDHTDRRHRRPAPGRGALREGVRRVRRRLRRPARRRPPGLRAGVEHPHQGARVGPADELPRAEHPLHRLRRPPRRPLPLLPRPGRAGQPPRHPLRRRHGPPVRRLQPGARRPSPTTSGPPSRAIPTTATSCSARRRGPRRSTPCAASCRRPRCPTSASTAAARRSRRCCCGCAPTRCPRPATTAS